ncbi:Major outer membrane lipoprotein Oprl [Dillenia turbinata]|uniref:Major outer membrane lipoprotein Oprl n=1 Tax=Dillenia turbinata TaxID=194707 RepID=A0AAN8UW90_9MAGN
MEETTSMTPREICIMKVGNLPGYRGHVSTSKQIEYDVQRNKQRADEAEKKACEAEKKADEAEKKACDAEKKADELAKKADEAENRSSQMNDEIIMLREKQALLEHRLESMMNMDDVARLVNFRWSTIASCDRGCIKVVYCTSLNWNADGSTLFCGYTDGVIRVWVVTLPRSY